MQLVAAAAALCAVAIALSVVAVQGVEGDLAGVSAEAAPAPAASAPESERGPFSVRLQRQLIPLHSDDGGVVHHKSAYHGQISVGGPAGQLFDVVFDTGSGHLVLPTLMCKAETCRQHRRYRRRASQLAQDIDVDGTPVSPWQARDQITITFGTGEVTGVFVRDRVCLGPPPLSTHAASLLQVDKARVHEVAQGAIPVEESDNATDEGAAVAAPAPPVPPPRHGCLDLRIIAATHMAEDPFASFAFDGVLGLGLSSLSQTPEFNFIGAAAAAGAWTGRAPGEERVFAVFLADSEEEESEITFGGWRSEHLDDGEEFAWVGVRDAQDGYWQVDIREIRAGGERLGFCDGGGCRGILDTGTSLLGVPSALGPELVWRLRHAAPGASCAGPGPRLEIDLGDITVVLDPSDYARPEFVEESAPPPAAGALGNGSSAAPAAEAAGGDGALGAERACVPMLMHIDLPDPLSPKTLILGEPVLQKYYTAFDGVAPRVGLGRARHLRPQAPSPVSV